VKRRSLLIFDGDDTLWETEALYDRARSDSAAIAQSVGLDPGRFEELQRRIDAENVRTMGLSADRFPQSSVQALTALAEESAITLTSSAVESVRRASAAVFDATAPLLPHAAEVVQLLAGQHSLALCTKGAPDVQERRIDDSGLREYFDRILVVPTKDSTTFKGLLHDFDVAAPASVSIGNSLPSDIAPALELGMHAIWIDAYVWIHERRPVAVDLDESGLKTAHDLSEIPLIVERLVLSSA
jgi:putative hydrolase of the HAD superfamily